MVVATAGGVESDVVVFSVGFMNFDNLNALAIVT